MTTASPTINVCEFIERLPKISKKLLLICGDCGSQGKYHVGRVIIDPSTFADRDAGKLSDEAVAFLGYFHCKHCGSAGPWEIPGRTMTWLALQGLIAARTPRLASVGLARFQMFDGTQLQTLALAEQYLQGLIEKDPENGFLWGRLGNIYERAELDDEAYEAFELAVKWNPRDIESYFSLAIYHDESGEPEEAAAHYHNVLRFAKSYERGALELKRSLVRESLERLFELHMESDGETEFLKFPEVAEQVSRSDDTSVVHLFEFDLSSDDSWERLTEMFVAGSDMPLPRNSRRKRQLLPEPVAANDKRRMRTGRNDPCPCGSGKKFKRCCGASN